MKVSVLLPVYNNKEDIATAILSVISQTYTDWELIIIDDCSTDGTADTIKKFLNNFSKFKINVIRNSKNMGVYVSLNEGLLKASGEYIIRIDSDDRYDPSMLQKQVAVLDMYPAYVASQTLCKSKTSVRQFGEITMMYRRCIIDKIGYYDSIRFAADTEFLYRLIRVYGKEKIYPIYEVLYHIKKRPNSLTTSKITGSMDIRNDYVKRFDLWHKKNDPNTKQTTNYFINNLKFNLKNNLLKSDIKINDIPKSDIKIKKKTNLYMPYPLLKRPFEVNSIMLP